MQSRHNTSLLSCKSNEVSKALPTSCVQRGVARDDLPTIRTSRSCQNYSTFTGETGVANKLREVGTVATKMYKDASDRAWGALLNSLPLSGTWSREEQILHSNQKEMLAILYALQKQIHYLRHSSILIQWRRDEVTSPIGNNISNSKIIRSTPNSPIQYIPGRYNNDADHLSRHRRTPGWHLLPACVQTVFAEWATGNTLERKAHVVHNYVSRDLMDPQALFHDAFSIPWNFPLAWVCPPPFLNHATKNHGSSQSVDGNIFNNSTSMGEGYLARGSQSTSACSTTNAEKSTQVSYRHGNVSATSAIRGYGHSGLEMWGWSEAIETWN